VIKEEGYVNEDYGCDDIEVNAIMMMKKKMQIIVEKKMMIRISMKNKLVTCCVQPPDLLRATHLFIQWTALKYVPNSVGSAHRAHRHQKNFVSARWWRLLAVPHRASV
jgi:hypothetical protein